MPLPRLTLFAAAVIATAAAAAPRPADPRQRAHDLGIAFGTLPTGPMNAITDVPGVRVGQVTRREGASVRTGVTAILPHGGNLFQDKVPAAIVVANGFGKLAGSSQVQELGEIETPVVLTNTLAVAEGIAGAVEWSLAQPGNERVRSVNAVVGETNDGELNDIRARVVTKADVRRAIETAVPGPVTEGAVGAGTAPSPSAGRAASARRRGAFPTAAPSACWCRAISAARCGSAAATLSAALPPTAGTLRTKVDGSIMIVVATDAPLSDRSLRRLAFRAFAGVARTGSAFSNGSGDYAIAFSTADTVRRTPARRSAVASYPETAQRPDDAAVRRRRRCG